MAGGVSSNYSDEDGGALSEINVTPLVDVVLVLLIVFMITVPALVRAARIKVDLPETTAAELGSEQVPLDLVLRLESSGDIQLYLDGKPCSYEMLKTKVENLGGPRDQVVSFSSDKAIPYGEVVKAIDKLGALGLHKLSLNTKHMGK